MRRTFATFLAAALLWPAAARAISQAEYECQESFERLQRFEQGWLGRVAAAKEPVSCMGLAQNAEKLVPPVSPSCRKLRFASLSPQFKLLIIRELTGGHRVRTPKKKVAKVYRQVYRRVLGLMRYRCRHKVVAAEEWEPGMPVPPPGASQRAPAPQGPAPVSRPTH